MSLIEIGKSVLSSCMDVKAGESVLVITDDRKLEIGNALYRAAKELGAEALLLTMEPRKVSGEEPPAVVAAAVKTAVFAAAFYHLLGFAVNPAHDVPRTDIIQSVLTGSPETLCAFCRGIQKGAPVDSFVTPMPWDMPGYDSQVIMAAGAFVQGSSIELSADGPIRPPYAVYFQGGLTWHHAKLGILLSLQKMMDKGLAAL